jgi:hypothetical protein
MAEDLDLKQVADQISGFTLEGYSDYEIDQALSEGYPEFTNKDSYDKHGEYIVGSAYKNFYVEMSKKIAPRGTVRYFQGLARNWLDTATFGTAKKVAALLISQSRDVPYDDVVEALSQEQEQFNQLYSGDALASSVAGGMTPVPFAVAKGGYNLISKVPWAGAMLTPKVGQTGANILKETVKSVPVGMGTSALYSAGTSDSMDEFSQRVVPEALIAGAGSALLTPPMMGATGAIARGLSSGKDKFKISQQPGVSRVDNERGVGVLAKQQESAGLTQQNVTDNLERIKKIDPALEQQATMMDVAGQPMTPATMGALGYPGTPQTQGLKNLAPFVQGQVERLKTFTANKLLKAPSIEEFRQRVNSERLKAGHLYDKMWKKGRILANGRKVTVKTDAGPQTLRLDEILDPTRPTVKVALASANELAAETRTILPQPNTLGFDAQHLHFIKMGYDQVLGRFGDQGLSGVMRMEATKNLKALVSFMDLHIPGYKTARNSYAMPPAENRAFNEGFKNMSRSTKSLENAPEIIETKFKDFSGHEKEAYKAGAARWLELFISEDMDPLSMVNKARQLSKGGLNNKVKAIWGKKTADEFGDYMEQSARMFQRRSWVDPETGSQTAPRTQAREMYQHGAGEEIGMPMSLREGITAGNRGARKSQLADIDRGAAQANAQRLTLPGRGSIMQNQADMQAWQQLQLLKDKTQGGRRGVVPGLLNPAAGEIQQRGGF